MKATTTATTKTNTKPKRKQKGRSKAYKATYTAWRNMLARCQNPKHPSWQHYGGRGVSVCAEWTPVSGQATPLEAFTAFLTHLGLRPTKGHTIDRKNPDGNYEPSNVRWATGKQQAINKRIPPKKVIHPTTKEVVLAVDLARELKISYQQLRYRMVQEGNWNAIPR